MSVPPCRLPDVRPACVAQDEPTTGLDSASAVRVMEALRRVSALGLTVLAVVHAPRVEIFAKFDDLVLLGRGGRVLYAGAAVGAIDYFRGMVRAGPACTRARARARVSRARRGAR
jgi:ABC-type multidrug transport system ATPase subunit